MVKKWRKKNGEKMAKNGEKVQKKKCHEKQNELRALSPLNELFRIEPDPGQIS